MRQPPSSIRRPGVAARREALVRLAGGALALGGLALPTPLRALGARREVEHEVEHPEPRPGITGEKVLPSADVPEKSRKAYDVAREIPQVLDGLYCHCECGKRDKLRSLLSCFETRMPTTCGVCRGEAEQAYELFLEGKTLGEIRKAVDRRWG